MSFMKRNDPFCLSEEASLGVLSADGNFEATITDFFYDVKHFTKRIEMSSYDPPYTITSKILRHVAKISEEITRLEIWELCSRIRGGSVPSM